MNGIKKDTIKSFVTIPYLVLTGNRYGQRQLH